MTIFFDASAVVAILTLESDAQELSDRAANHDVWLISAMAKWETVSALTRSHEYTLADARRKVDDMIADNAMLLVPIGEQEAELALDAFFRFGKGRHAAKLNMGDCFAYACAKANNAKLLYKGNDFTNTDLACA